MHCMSTRAGKSPSCSGRCVSRTRATFVRAGARWVDLNPALLDSIASMMACCARAMPTNNSASCWVLTFGIDSLLRISKRAYHRGPMFGPEQRRIAFEAALGKLVPAADHHAQEQIGIRRLIGRLGNLALLGCESQRLLHAGLDPVEQLVD